MVEPTPFTVSKLGTQATSVVDYYLACLISCGEAATSGRNLHDKSGLP
jgi:hypothetical protein